MAITCSVIIVIDQHWGLVFLGWLKHMHMTTLTRYEVKELSWPERTFAIIRATKTFDELKAFFPESYMSIFHNLQKAGIESRSMPCAIYYDIDEEKRLTDVAAAIPLDQPGAGLGYIEKIQLPASKLVSTTHYGPYDTMGLAYQALDKYLASHLLRRGLVIEEYFTDPVTEPDPEHWKTNIYYVVHPIATSN